MSVMTTERPAPVGAAVERAPGTRRRPLRPGRGSGRATRPQAQPPRPVRGPELERDSTNVARGCRLAAPRAIESTLRLTDRGIALILVTGLAIATAALVVVGLTAVRVTGDSYLPIGQSGQISVQP